MATNRAIAEPNGCARCGIPKPHGWQWIEGVGLHQWQPPTDAQIKARMQARRNARTITAQED
jgi:GH25 family lysozyme M1 (1,4-beta-N-acetylmuramidase)